MSRRGDEQHRPGEQGFTLVEVLIVIGIVVLSASVFVVSLERPGVSFTPKAMAVRLAAELRHARDNAHRLSKTIAFTLNAEERWYQVDGFKRVAIPTNIDVTLETAKPLVAAESSGRLVFFSDGSSTGGQIVLARGARQQTVSVNWLTGTISAAASAQD